MRLLPVAVPILLAAAMPAVASAAPPTGNLLQNPNAEVAPTMPSAGVFSPPAGWSAVVTDPDSTYGPRDACYGGTDTESDVIDREFSTPIDGGARFFFGGQNVSTTLTQNIAVAAADVAGRSLLFGGAFGGYSSQEDRARLQVSFFNGATQLGATVSTDPVSSADRGGTTGFVARSKTAVTPANTTRVQVQLVQDRLEGTDNDGYADNLYATYDAVAPARPAPTGDATCVLTVTPPTPTPPPAPAPAPAPLPVPIPKPKPTPTPVPVPKPKKKPSITTVVSGLPSTKACVSRRSFRIRLRNPRRTKIKSATVRVNGNVVATRKGRRVTAPVDLKGLPKGRYKVSITVKLANGTTVKGTRRYRTCAPKRRR